MKKLIIRKQASVFTMIKRALILVALWGVTGYIVYINGSFLSNIYSDSLISGYLLLNLSFQSYIAFATLVIVVSCGMFIFGWWRIRRLKRKAGTHE
ncbi:hypothetical protein G8J22_00608 [Lentilactobacillus hilgardii]|nr:hypothetical protein G8J22_00608 [Lentilactobacillus hilgardii]